MLKKIFGLVKPGIIFGNTVNFIGAFLLAAIKSDQNKLFDELNAKFYYIGSLLNTFNVSHSINYFIYIFIYLIVALLGIIMIIASGCIINNYFDRDIDKKMKRTQSRLLTNDQIAMQYGKIIVFIGIIIGVFGACFLYVFCGIYATSIAIIGHLTYVILYTMWLKRNSLYGVLIGGISGATPPVVGYLSIHSLGLSIYSFDSTCLLIFIILVVWQMPHAYAISIYRMQEYESANITTFPATKGRQLTEQAMLWYVIIFSLSLFTMYFVANLGIVYLIYAILCSILWIKLASSRSLPYEQWARKMFGYSIISIMLFSTTIAVPI